MRKIYILFNYDINEVILATEDKEFAQECMCDCFMADVEYLWLWEQYHPFEKIDEAKEYAKNLWDDMIEWYNNNIDIIEEEIV